MNRDEIERRIQAARDTLIAAHEAREKWRGRCRTCLYGRIKGYNGTVDRCVNPVITGARFDPVSGKISCRENGYTSQARDRDFGLCGPEGKLHQFSLPWAAWHCVEGNGSRMVISTVAAVLLATAIAIGVHL